MVNVRKILQILGYILITAGLVVIIVGIVIDLSDRYHSYGKIWVPGFIILIVGAINLILLKVWERK